MAKSTPPFRVIVVGGGVTGLVASHSLQKAGIDHVVLERRDVVAPAEGASIGIYPHGARILHQIGCLEAVQAACVPGGKWYVRGEDGKTIMENDFFRHVEANHGIPFLLLERRKYLQILYDQLPDKTPIRTGCGVNEIKHTATGVEVTLSNGTVEVGDVVIGCDGAYSKVRGAMWDRANEISPGLITVKEKTSFKTGWKALIGVAPNAPELGRSDMTVASHHGCSFLSLAQPDRVYFFFFFRVDEPFNWPKRAFYSGKDADELADSVADYAISDSLLFGELWRKRLRGALVNIEEGVLEHWHAGRIVLAGDSAHKVTPNIALGGNSGMESVVVLCNQLNRLVSSSRGGKPSLEDLDEAFAAYQAACLPRVRKICDTCSLITRIQAWDTPLHKFTANWLMPMQPDKALAAQVGEIVRAGAKLDYVDDAGFPTGGKLSFRDSEKPSGKSFASRALFSSRWAFGTAAALMVVVQGVRVFAHSA